MRKMTTIKLSTVTRTKLGKLKGPTETYEDAITRLLEKQELEHELAECYRKNAKEYRRIAKEWEGTTGDGL